MLSKIIYILVIVLILAPLSKLGLPFDITAPVALAIGLVYAIVFENPFPKFNKKCSKYLLQVAVVCLGFNMNLTEALKSGMMRQRNRCEWRVGTSCCVHSSSGVTP